jgi:diguanylate cyclase (GGDEF)-like protein
MKIGEAPRSRPVRKTAGPSPRPDARDAPPPAPVDAVEVLGVPESELTPRVRRALTTLIEEVRALRAELQQMRARVGELEQLADADPLLKVLNRRAFVRELNRALAMVERYGTKASLIFIDVDGLKQINDAYGHAAGDAVLAHVAATLGASVRQTDAVGRLGGDEFGVILLQADNTVARAKSDALAALVGAKPLTWRGVELAARISTGVFEIKKGLSADDALATADDAMYRNKRRS